MACRGKRFFWTLCKQQACTEFKSPQEKLLRGVTVRFFSIHPRSPQQDLNILNLNGWKLAKKWWRDSDIVEFKDLVVVFFYLQRYTWFNLSHLIQVTSGVASLLSSWTGTWWSQRHETAGKSREKSNCPAPTPMPNSWPVFKTILSLQGTITYPLPRDFWRFSFSEGGFCDRSLQGSRSRGKWRHHYGGKNPLRRYSFNELQHWKQNTWTPAISFLHIFNKTGEDYVCMYKLIYIYIYIFIT